MTEQATLARLTPRPRQSPARVVQEEIRGLEKTIDTALAGGADLLSLMIRAGQVANLLPAESQAAIEHAIAGIEAGSTMRAQVLAVHGELRTISGQINLRELGWRDLVPSPETRKTVGVALATETVA